MKKRTRTLILCLAIFVVAAASGFGLWYLLRDKAPVGNGNVLNVAWYHENGTEFIITTADELFEFAELSEYYNFKEQTIKLGADIVVNEGNAEDWENTLPERSWKSIRNFAGTFDGQGHSISGLYGLGHLYALKGADKIFYTTGMFAETNAKCTIKNFKLLNSYFCSDLNEGVGSISSSGGGTFENIYSDAIVVSYKSNNGGIIGLFNQKGTISNCWFDGELRVEGTVGRFTGGIAGRVCATNGQSKIEHCLNTADISSTVINRGMNTGGLIGNIQSQARINITDCLTVGDLTVDYTSGVGAFVGNIESSSAVIIKNTYVKAEAFEEVIYNANGTMTGAAVAHNEAMLTGYNAYKWSELDFKDYWAVVEDGTPILKSFADEVPSLEGVKKGYDISWYRPGEGEYLIKTPEQLYGLAILSYSNNFVGQAIYLGDNIVLNEGNAEDWATNAPENKWFSIGTYGFPFEGTFDGCGYTISGVYLNSCGGFGLFGDTSSSTAISNFKLENSYFEASGQTIGSIVGLGAGTIQNVYSNAIVVGHKGNVGGFAGQAKRYAGLQMSNCWFDGKATNLGNKSDTKKIGGLIGAVRSESAMNNCLNTGIIDASVFNYNQAKKKVNGVDVVDTENPTVVPIVGGLIGYVEKEVPFGIQDCLNVGKVLYNEAATAAYASVIGYIDGNVTAQNVYAATESCDNHPLKQSVVGQVCPIDTADLTGYKAYQWTLLDFDKYWAVNKKGTPILKSFAEEVPSLEGVKKEVDVSWYSTDKKTFILDSRQDLFGFRLMSYNTDFAEKTVKLGKNITVNTGEAAKWAESVPQYKWIPVGTQKYSFKGTFDGAMHSISGIYVKTDTEFSGFFGVLTADAEVKNLKIMNSYYESSADFIGSIAGACNANISNVYSNATIVSSANTASGIIGRTTKDVKISNCWFDGSATVTGKGMPNRRAAGIVGFIYSGKVTLSHCLNSGTIAAPNYVGTNSETSKAVVPMIGGLLGYVGTGSELLIEDSLNTGDVIWNPAATTGYGSILGYSDGKTTVKDTFATVESCETQALGKVTGVVTTYKENAILGYAGYQWLDLDFDKHWAVVISPTAGTPVLKSFVSNAPSVAGIEKMIDTSWYNEKKTEYILKDKADLNGFAYLSNSIDFAGKTVKLGANITMNADMSNPAYEWDPIGSAKKPFAGTFDGQMHTISGLYLNTNVEGAGLFAKTDKTAVVKNFILKDSYFESTAMSLGSIAGIGHGIFDTIKSEATVVGHNARVGGLVGFNLTKGTKMTNCWFAGTVTNKGNGEGLRGTGGLVGVTYSDTDLTIQNCLNTGTVDASAYQYKQSNGNITVLVGGLVGWVRRDSILTLGASLNTGEVKMSSAATNGYGSVVGYVDGTVENSAKFYTTVESNISQMNNGKAKLVIVNKNDIIGLKGYQRNVLDLDFVKYWTFVVDDEATTDKDEADTPILQAFADKIIDVTTVAKLFDTGWKDKAQGTETDPYILTSMADLFGLSELAKTDSFAGKHFKLANDIVINKGDAADWATKAPTYNWTPIGTSSNRFAGIFDGNNHTISGVYLKTSERHSGFFGATGEGAVIRNLRLRNSYMESTRTSGQAEFGGVVGNAIGTFETIYSDAIVVGHAIQTGGILGYVSGNTTINNVWFDGSVTNTKTTDLRIGGIVGNVAKNVTADFSNCLNTGAISGPNATGNDVCIGGIVGWVGTSATMTNCLGLGPVSALDGGNNIGSIAGHDTGSVITVTNVFGTAASHKWKGVTKAKRIENSNYATILGENAATTLTGFDFNDVWAVVEGNTPVLKSFYDIMVDISWYDASESTFVLDDMADLYGFTMLSKENTFEGKTIKLGADIVVNAGEPSTWGTYQKFRWIPIGTFAGTFDGAYHTISGIFFDGAQQNAGLFSATTGTTILKDFKLENAYVKNTGKSYTGSIVGYGNGTIQNVHSNAEVYSNNKYVGGLVGGNSNAISGFTMTLCSFGGSVESSYAGDIELGGLIGYLRSPNCIISNCLNTGTVKGTNAESEDVGGLIGCAAGDCGAGARIENLLNVGTVTNEKTTSSYTDPVIGYKNSKVTGTNNLYAITTTKTGTKVSSDDIKGDAAKTTLSDFDFTNIWKTRKDDTPVLRFEESK